LLPSFLFLRQSSVRFPSSGGSQSWKIMLMQKLFYYVIQARLQSLYIQRELCYFESAGIAKSISMWSWQLPRSSALHYGRFGISRLLYWLFIASVQARMQISLFRQIFQFYPGGCGAVEPRLCLKNVNSNDFVSRCNAL
jgi:hypothetical protein